MSVKSPTLAAPAEPAARPVPLSVGFLSFAADHSGVSGGYLLTNSWGRPLEFRLSSAVCPTRVQQLLYGHTIDEYLHGELIGRTLIEKAYQLPSLVVTDHPAALSLAQVMAIPTLLVAASLPGGVEPVAGARCGLAVGTRRGEAESPDLAAVVARLDPTLDLAEPFGRIKEAMAEARKSGGLTRAA